MKLTIRNGSVTLEGNTILECVNVDITDHTHAAIVGRNGSGKTTLLKAIYDNELFSEGIEEEKFQIERIGKFSIGYMRQVEFEDENLTLLDEIKKSFQDLINMEEKLNDYVIKLNENNSDKIIREYTDLQERFKLLGGYSYKKEYEVMLSKFGFAEADKSKLISEFSGGQKTKIAFIKLLLSKPDLLLLDEPTNHLDIETIEWLETYLKNYKKALIIVSHDRMLINNIVDVVYDIDYGKVVKYPGNYTNYEKMKKEIYEKTLKDYEFQKKEIKRLQSIYERFRFKPSKASMALSKLKQIERMDLIDKPIEADMRVFQTNLSEIAPSVKKVLTCDNLEIGYDKVLATINLEIMRGKKIGVIGKNGIGKSTLLKTLNGTIDPISGNVSYGLNVTPGYFDQNLAMSDSNQSVLAEFRTSLPELHESECRKALGSFLFKGDDVFKPINVLSGGEKVRLQLCKIFFNKPNFLILDEPTNHMDIVGRDHLEDILEYYKGTMIFVSHDRYFIKKIANQLLVFDDNGVKFYPFGYDQYLETIKNDEPIEPKKDKKKKTEEVVEEIPKVNTYELKKELNKLENEIIKKETKIKLLEQDLFNTDVYSDYNKSMAINEKIKLLKEELTELNNKWEELTNLILEN
ncbi:MAG: ABC-F family ATP-binding cassette domain-containing protein [Erysipelotrichales bacterium]|nr:ABC-F family ATP-binding cassette domain-containing protein [Erysipelotrichales bacterium]